MEDDERKPDQNAQTSNRVFSKDEMEAAFGRHPDADWKPVIRRTRNRRWMKRAT